MIKTVGELVVELLKQDQGAEVLLFDGEFHSEVTGLWVGSSGVVYLDYETPC